MGVKNIGIIGGTFDPIHLGHLIVAEEARVRLKIDEVQFVPAGQPWLKGDRVISPSTHRLEMVRLATLSNPNFRVSAVDIDRPGPSYTVDTIAALKSQLGEGTRLFFILGWDSLEEFPLWKDPAQLVEMCQIVAVARPGYNPPDLSTLEATIPGVSKGIIFLETPLIGISSSEIRRRVAQGLSIHHLVPEVVERYIREKGLYL